jgi:hypothetical protein
LSKRSDFLSVRHFCHVFADISLYHLVQNIVYLRSLPGKPTSKAGPGLCARASCHGDAAIYWCNDVSVQIVCVWLQWLVFNSHCTGFCTENAEFLERHFRWRQVHRRALQWWKRSLWGQHFGNGLSSRQVECNGSIRGLRRLSWGTKRFALATFVSRFGFLRWVFFK